MIKVPCILVCDWCNIEGSGVVYPTEDTDINIEMNDKSQPWTFVGAKQPPVRVDFCSQKCADSYNEHQKLMKLLK